MDMSSSMGTAPSSGEGRRLAWMLVEVTLFDALGRRVATLHDGDSAPELSGTLELSYDGRRLAPGVYVVRVRSETGTTAQAGTVAR